MEFSGETEGHDLTSYLIMPVQRLPRFLVLFTVFLSSDSISPRYQMLIDGLLKYTPLNHADYANLKQARDQVVHVIKEIERDARWGKSISCSILSFGWQSFSSDRDHRERILQLQYQLNLPNLFTGNEKRRLVADGNGLISFHNFLKNSIDFQKEEVW